MNILWQIGREIKAHSNFIVQKMLNNNTGVFSAGKRSNENI